VPTENEPVGAGISWKGINRGMMVLHELKSSILIKAIDLDFNLYIMIILFYFFNYA
jgi:hypothetical protein